MCFEFPILTLRPKTFKFLASEGAERAFLAVASVAVVLWFAMDTPLGLPLDDAWIHLVHARQIVVHGNLLVAGGVESSAVTSPLWTLLLAGVYSLTADPVLSVRILALLVMPLLVLGMREAARAAGLSRIGSLSCGLLTLFSGPLLWLDASGMETALFAAAIPWALWAGARHRYWTLGFVIALALLVRIEGLVLVVLALILLVRDRDLRSLVPVLGLPALTLAVFVAWNLARTGHPLPSTLDAKQFAHGVGLLPWTTDVSIFAWGWFGYFRAAFGTVSPVPLGGWVMLTACIGGLAVLLLHGARVVPLGFLVVVLAINLAYLLFLPVQGAAGRYEVVNWLVPPLLMGAAISWIGDRGRWRAVAAVLLAFLLVQHVAVAGVWRTTFQDNVQHILNTHVRAARILARVNEDCRPILAYDVGAVAYFASTGACHPELVDLGGLLDSSLIPVLRSPRALQRLALERGGNVWVVLPTTLRGSLLSPPLGVRVQGIPPYDRLVDPDGLLEFRKVGEGVDLNRSKAGWLVVANARRMVVWLARPTARGRALMRQGPAAVALLSQGKAPTGQW